MKKKLRLCSVILCIVMLFTSLSVCVCAKKQTEAINPNAGKTYEIAVVFDNSGSMYANKSWCRAKYAMEIFASMLPFNEGDSLSIYPMWNINTDGNSSTAGSTEPLRITSREGIDKISNLYTTEPGNTPLAPIKEAYNDLSKSEATVKWLIVMTDGAFNYEGRNRDTKFDCTKKNLTKLLKSYADEEKRINVQYLAIGSQALTLESSSDSNFYANETSDKSEQMRESLISIANRIFSRSELPSGNLKGETLTLPMSMSNLFIVAQGENVSVTLKDSNGNEETPEFSRAIKYSTISAGANTHKEYGPLVDYSNAPVDKSLSGHVITYGELDGGDYTLSTSGATSISIYYEPDVLLKATLTDEEGNSIDLSDNTGDITAGEYKINASIVDKSGNDVTDNSLLGSVNFGINLYDKDGKTGDEISNGSTVLVPDTATGFGVYAEYLDGYRLSSVDDVTGLPGFNFTAKTPDDLFSIDVEVTQSGGWYNSKKISEAKPIVARVTYNGENLSEKDFAKLAPEFTLSDEGIIRDVVADAASSSFYIYIGRDSSGNYNQVADGNYKINGSVTYTNELGTFVSSDSDSFDVHSAVAHYIKLIVFALVLLALLITAAIIVYFLFIRSYYPKEMFIVTDDDETIRIRRNKDKCRAGEMTFSVQKNKKTTFFKRGNEKAKIKIHGLTFNDEESVRNFSIDGTEYLRRQGKFVNGSGAQYDMDEEMIISHGDEISFRDSTGTTRGTFRMNKKK